MFRSRDHGGRAMPEARSVRREVVIKSGIYPGGYEGLIFLPRVENMH